MLDLPRLQNIQLSANPRMQKLVGLALLMPNYELPPRVRIRLEGVEHLPAEPVIYAMNHTDRYNYWPFQYRLWRELGRFTATWVKGKYYENRVMARFLAATNNIPAPSRGYVLTKDFTLTVGRAPGDAEYRALRALCDGGEADPSVIPAPILQRARNVLGLDFDPAQEGYPAFIARIMEAMNERFIALNQECFEKGLDLLIFPQGTRSVRLSQGHIGLAQVALRFRRPIVPVGCSGSDKVYPGNSPVARRGTITYRIGAPLSRDALAEHALPDGVDPFEAAGDPAHRAAMQALVDRVMERIDGLVDPAYRFAADQASDGVAGSRRFV